MALHYGYCDFAQYDGVGRATSSLSSGILLLSFPKYPANPNFVIPRAVAESIFACQRSSRRSQRPRHSTSVMTGGVRSDGERVGGGDAVALPTPSSVPAHTVTLYNTVILREVAVSIVECRGCWILWLMRWQAEMDSATARGMTKFGCWGYFGNGGGKGHGFRDCARNDEVCVLRVLREWWGVGDRLHAVSLGGGGLIPASPRRIRQRLAGHAYQLVFFANYLAQVHVLHWVVGLG